MTDEPLEEVSEEKLPHPPTVARQTRDALKRQKAFEEFYALGVKNRSVNALFKKWVALAREDPENKKWIPTLNRDTIYRWSKEDRWDLRCQQRELAQSEAMARDYEETRKRGYDQIALLQDNAILALNDLVTSHGTRDDVRLRAATEILDRTGVVSINQNKVPKDAKPQQPKAPATTPSAGDSDETMMRFLAEKAKNRQ